MAEGGSSPTESGSGSPHPKSSTDIRKDHQFDAHLLECPICLEQMRQPKSLPCLHSFCQECLSTYIVKDLSEKTPVTSFPCPVCRKIAQPVNSSDSKETWAEQFPTNTLIEGLIVLKQKADEPLYCKFCTRTKNVEMPATIWCKSINALFCDSCKVSYHDILHDDCHTVDVTGNLLSFQKSSNVVRCSSHKKELEYYCVEHQTDGCAKCMILDHRGCGVKTTEEYCQQINYPDIDNSLEKANDTMDLLVKDLDEQVEVMLRDQDTWLGSIAERRQRLDTYLDQKQKEITDQCIAVYKEEKAKVELTIQKCDRLRTGMKNTRDTLATARTGNDYQEISLLYQRGRVEIKSCRDLVMEMTTGSITVRISHEVDVIHCDLSQDSSLTLGSVRVQKFPRLLPDLSWVSVTPPLIECHVKKIGNIRIKSYSDSHHCSPIGVVYMPGGLIVVGDYQNDTLKLFTGTDERLDELQISGYLHDMCIVYNNTVAVAVHNTSVGIHVVKVEDNTLSLLSEIKLPGDKPCYGITYTGDRFIVTTPNEVYSVTQEGKGVKLCDLSTESRHLAYDPKGGRTIVSHNTSTDGKVAVFIMSATRRTNFLEVGVVKGARGVDVDREGNVYVCGGDSNNVVQISADGKHVRELLTSSEGVEHPRTIAVCGDKFVLTNDAPNQRDTIHVYQLY